MGALKSYSGALLFAGIIFIGFGATFQIPFEKYTFLSRFEKSLGSYHGFVSNTFLSRFEK